MQKESAIQTKIIKYLDSLPDCWSVKTVVVNKPGTPDILCCYKGRFYAFEVKTSKGVVSKLQDYRIAEIQSAEGVALAVRSVEEVERVLNEKQDNC